MPRSSARRVWSKAGNDALQLREQSAGVAAALASFAFTHSFRRDLLAYCRLVGVTPHPKLLPLHPDEEESLGADATGGGGSANVYDLTDIESVAVKNWQLDRGNCHGLCFVLPQCAKIHSVCLFNVVLDREQLELVCHAIPKTQVQVLQLEWNESSEQQAKARAKARDEVSAPVPTESSEAADTSDGSSTSGASGDSKQQQSDSEDHNDSVVYAHLLVPESPLVFLSLRANGISARGAVEIARALRANATLQSLNLFQNRIGDDGALAIAHALPHNSTLKSLSVASNGITGSGAMAFVGAITRYEAPPALLKEIEDAESRILAELEHAKKAKKKGFDRRAAMANLGLPLFEIVDGVQFAPGNTVLEELVLSGNAGIAESDALAMSDALDAFQSKLQTHLRHLKLQRIPSLWRVAGGQRGSSGPKLSDFLVL